MSQENLSPEARQILALAKQESENLQHFYLGVEHVFIALTKVEDGITQAVLQQFKLDPKQVRDAVRLLVGTGDGHRYWQDIRVTPRCEAVLKLAGDEAGKRQGTPVDEKDLLLAILKEGESIPVRMLKKMDVSISALIEAAEEAKVPVAVKKIPYASETRLLDKFGRDITRLAKEGKIDPVIGRSNEILQLVRTLTRKTKNNPMLIGEAGVGKTAVVEGLALRIAQGKLTESLRDKRIIELSLASVVAGTKYRGEFEERIMGIINESKDHPEVILFLDEIHTMVGAEPPRVAWMPQISSSQPWHEEKSNASVLPPSTSTGNILKRTRLERRFQIIMVNEPSIEDTIEILKQLKERYEKHHNVKITESATEAAVRLTVKYVPDRRLPDKALDALDEACTGVKVPFLSMYRPEGSRCRCWR